MKIPREDLIPSENETGKRKGLRRQSLSKLFRLRSRQIENSKKHLKASPLLLWKQIFKCDVVVVNYKQSFYII